MIFEVVVAAIANVDRKGRPAGSPSFAEAKVHAHARAQVNSRNVIGGVPFRFAFILE